MRGPTTKREGEKGPIYKGREERGPASNGDGREWRRGDGNVGEGNPPKSR